MRKKNTRRNWIPLVSNSQNESLLGYVSVFLDKSFKLHYRFPLIIGRWCLVSLYYGFTCFIVGLKNIHQAFLCPWAHFLNQWGQCHIRSYILILIYLVWLTYLLHRILNYYFVSLFPPAPNFPMVLLIIGISHRSDETPVQRVYQTLQSCIP